MINKKKLFKGKNGITLVALVITIIILLILAGITLNLTFGENGLLRRAQQGENAHKVGEANDINSMDKATDYMNRYINGEIVKELPDNTPDTKAGTEVKVPNNWATETMRPVKTADGKDVTDSKKIATVYAIAVGKGETVPVPYGFWYVGGDLNTGVIISDEEADKYDGVTDKTTWEYTTSLVGNQFVWIPCSASKYKKCDTWAGTKQTDTTLANSWWDTTTPSSEKTQIQKYGGFYVGRYEMGLATTIAEYETEQQHDGANQVYNKSGIPQSKAGQIPWIFIDWNKSKENAESMYNTDTVYSGLITGTQWDVMLNKMVEKTDKISAGDLTNSGKWGNYIDNEINYKGRKAVATYKSNAWYLSKFGEVTEGKTEKYNVNTNYEILTTGASRETEAYHIYDVAGNVWEFIEEASYYGGNTSTQYRVLRGGASNHEAFDTPSCWRSGDIKAEFTHAVIGTRLVLYIK